MDELTEESARNTSRKYCPWIIAGLGGFLWAIAFPKWGVNVLGWFVPALLLLAALPFPQKPAPRALVWWKRPFRLGRFQVAYFAGFVHYLTSLYWLLFIPHLPGAIAGWLAISLYLAVYPALWVVVCGIILRRFESANADSDPDTARPLYESQSNYRDLLLRIGKLRLSQRMTWSLLCASAWVGWEMLVARMLTGFPWNLLGASQFAEIPLIQIAAFTGVYGVSFLLVWFSVSVLTFCSAIYAQSIQKREPQIVISLFPRALDVALPLICILSIFVWGFRHAMAPTQAGPSLKLALVQPSIPQTLIWDRSQNAVRFDQLIALSERALAEKPDILVWPEASVPELLRHDPATAQRVQRLVREHSVHMILGADDAAPKTPDAKSFRDYNFYNSSFALTPDGNIVDMYRKRRLVMFGEYVPFIKFLPFLKYVSPIGDVGFTPGDRPVAFDLKALGARVSVLICFEDVFPHLAREHVDDSLDFLINLTNNGWFGESAAQWQHGANAVFRAVENGLPLVRCSNNGLTCWVDERGRMFEVFYPGTKDIYSAGFKIVNVPTLPQGKKREPTFYTRHGDVFGWGCFGVAALALLRSRGKKPISPSAGHAEIHPR